MKKSKIVFVTGCNRGLGLAVCRNLLNKNHIVIASVRDRRKGKNIIAELKADFPDGQLELLKLDVQKQTDITKCFKYIQKKFGHLDCLINNAGILFNDGIDTTSHSDFTQVIQTNLVGPFLICNTFLPLLLNAEDPRIINVSSQLGSLKNSGPGFGAYRVSKTGLNSLSRTLHFEMESQQQKLKVFSVCPGWVHTDMGGPRAPRTPAKGAKSILYPFYTKSAKSGSFYQDGKVLPW